MLSNVSVLMTKILLFSSLIFSASASGHVSQTQGATHQAEHLFWALAIISMSWVLMPVVENLKHRLSKR